jgi:putative ABC transport system permease protein
MGLFALLVFGLAAIGLAGLMSFHAAVRMREFALRLALGAAPASLAGMVVMRAVRLTALGGVAGGFITIAAAPLARQLPGGSVSATGSGVYVLVIALLGALAIVASIGPALRAARLNPARALRQE